MVALPPLPKMRLSLLSGTLVSIIIIDTHDGPCESGDFSEADQQAFVYLALRSDVHPAEQEH